MCRLAVGVGRVLRACYHLPGPQGDKGDSFSRARILLLLAFTNLQVQMFALTLSSNATSKGWTGSRRLARVCSMMMFSQRV